VIIGLDGGHHAIFAPDSQNTLAAAAVNAASRVHYLFPGMKFFEIPDNSIAACFIYCCR
jgi:hypothetical protein